MELYAEQVSRAKLFQQFDALAGYEDLTQADIAKLKQLILDVADAVGPHLDRIRDTFWQYTEHDLRHLCNIADLVYRFLPKQPLPSAENQPDERIRLNAIELALLWLAILLHDIGMYVDDGQKQSTLESDDYREFLRHQTNRVSAAEEAREAGLTVKARAIEDALLAEYFRRQHPQRVRKYLSNKLARKVRFEFRGVSLAEDVSNICESHAWGVRESNDPRDADKTVARLERNRRIISIRVNLQYLACCLRLGDILDFDKTRTPMSVYEQIDFTEDESIKEWNKHLSIEGWDVNEHRVLFDGKCAHPAYYVAVHNFLNCVDNELRECRYLLDEAPAGDESKYALHLAHVVDRRQVRMGNKRYVAGGFRFRLEYEEIMQLLLDRSLYPDSALFLRELLQNSLDACRYQQALAKEADMEDKYVPRITVWDHSDNEEAPQIIFQDNGIGMSQPQVENFFLRVGKSFYRSPEFEAEKQRLSEQGIHLYACSQFGIGFLSCFLAGDKIEIVTCRFGSDPLKITITGSSKYFLIERLPRQGESIRFKSPDHERYDGPPRFSGTRITVYLRPGWRESYEAEERSVVRETLETFAVNQEYDIRIHHANDDKDIVIRGRGGREREPMYCGAAARSQDLQAFVELNLVPSLLEQRHGNYIQSILAPSVFSLGNCSAELLGDGAIWMLKDSNGEPCPAVGDLCLRSIGSPALGDLHLRSIGSLAEACISVIAPELALASRLNEIASLSVADLISEFVRAEPENADEAADEFEFILEGAEIDDYSMIEREEFVSRAVQEIREFTPDQMGWFMKFCSCISDSSGRHGYWWQNEQVLFALAQGDRDSLLSIINQQGFCNLTDDLKMSSKYSLSLFGINVPALVLDWNPSSGQSKKRAIAPFSVGVRVDAYGTLAPQPSANRLFVPGERSSALRLAVGSEIIRHAVRLTEDNSDDGHWKRWFRDFVKWCEPIADSVVHNIGLLQDCLEVQCVIEGRPVEQTLREAHEVFGDFAAACEQGNLAKNGILTGVLEPDSVGAPHEAHRASCDSTAACGQFNLDEILLPAASLNYHWLMKYLRKRTTEGDLVVDLSALGSHRTV